MGSHQGGVPKLPRIAPTVAPSADFVDGGTPWQDQTRIIGRALGQESPGWWKTLRYGHDSDQADGYST